MAALALPASRSQTIILWSVRILMAALFLFLAFTRTGKAMRAVADNPTLASVKGIDSFRSFSLVQVTSS